MNYSVTYAGLVVSVVGIILKRFGVPFVEGEIQSIVDTAFQLGGLLIAAWGRFRQGDITVAGFKL